MKENSNSRNEKTNKPNGSNVKWLISVFITTFILSLLFSFISTYSMNNIHLLPAIIILILVIFVGIIFDIIGVAVTVAEEENFNAIAAKKIKGAKSSIKLIKHSAKVANFCADVIGDICGVLSGAISAIIAIKIGSFFNLNFSLQFLISALVASITVGGKAIGKTVAQQNSTKIVHFIGKLISKFNIIKK